LRHARARNIVVRAETLDNGRVRLEVRDDGCGFDLRDVGVRIRDGRHASGFGLSNIRERAAAVGGSARIDSEPGQGTRVLVDVPRHDR
jgi:signal transduction histidine kinase